MALPVLAGPFRCALIYNHEKQPLIELSIRVSLPLVDLLRALSQVAPPIGVKEPKAQRPPAKAPGGDTQREYPSGSPTPSGNWRGYPLPPTWHHSYGQQAGDSRHSWEPCPTAPITPNTGPRTSTLSTTSDAQVDEQVQLLWALSDRKEDPPRGSAPVKKQQRREVRLRGQADREPVAAAPPAEAKPGLPREEGDQDWCQGHPDFRPPERPGAHPKKNCPVQ